MGAFSCWFARPQVEDLQLRAFNRYCSDAKAAVQRTLPETRRLLEECQRQARNPGARSGIQRPVHAVVHNALQLKYLELLPSLIDQLSCDAADLFASDRPFQTHSAATFLFLASRLQEVPELKPIVAVLSDSLGSGFVADSKNDKTCQAKGVPLEVYRLSSSPRVRARLLTDALGDAAALQRLNLDSAESSPIKPSQLAASQAGGPSSRQGHEQQQQPNAHGRDRDQSHRAASNAPATPRRHAMPDLLGQTRSPRVQQGHVYVQPSDISLPLHRGSCSAAGSAQHHAGSRCLPGTDTAAPSYSSDEDCEPEHLQDLPPGPRLEPRFQLPDVTEQQMDNSDDTMLTEQIMPSPWHRRHQV